MAPALTEAATQIRAKLPTVGHTAVVSGDRVNCSASSSLADPLSVSHAPVVGGYTPQSHLSTLPKQHHLVGKTLTSFGNIGIRRVSCLAGTAFVKASLNPLVLHVPAATPLGGTAIVGGSGVGKARLVANLQQQEEAIANSGAATDTSITLDGTCVRTAHLVANLQEEERITKSGTGIDTSVRSGGGLMNTARLVVANLQQQKEAIANSGTTTDTSIKLGTARLVTNLQQQTANSGTTAGTSTGELVRLPTVNRMNKQDKLAAAHLQHTPSPGAGTSANTTGTLSPGVGVNTMPHPAAAPSIHSKATGMGYTSKTTPRTEPPVTPSGTSPTELDTALSLQTVEDVASIILTDVQSGCSTGMADVGLLNNVDRVAETAKRQKELERHADRLVRRLRRIQSRQSISHVQHQLSGFVDHQHKNLQTMAKAMKPQPTNSVDLKAELLQSEDVKSLSTAALVSLVRRLQTSQAMTLRQRLANSNQSSSDGTSVLRLDEDLCTEMNRVSSTLQKDLKHLESALDSDATESSSGGESCDEYDYDEEKIPKTCLRRRAEWKWAMERAGVAAKWTWLQAQVSDLEYRIRQQSDIYRQIRAAKGAVVLGDPVPPEDLLAALRVAAITTSSGTRPARRLSPLEEKIANLERKNEISPSNLSRMLSNVDKQSTRLTEQLGNVLSPADTPLLPSEGGQNAATCTPSTPPAKASGRPQNGFPVSSGSGTDTSHTKGGGGSVPDGALGLSFDPPSPALDTSCQAARCRPVRSYGKRKLLTTCGLYQLSRKAARLSTVPCYCYPPTMPCAMCGGRYNNKHTIQPTVMPVGERVSLIDPAYHQVLSFPQDTPLPVHFESLLRCGEWQHRPLPTKPLRPIGATKGKQKPPSERKYRKNATLLSSNKIRSKYDMKQKLGSNHGSESVNNLSEVAAQNSTHSLTHESKLRKRKSSLSAVIDGSRKKRSMSTSSVGPPAPSPTSASPRDTPSPLSHSCLSSTLRDMKDAQRRRRGESAFDINNIVIPYSMAASTRVEKLLYKEIITPKWRRIVKGADPEDEVALTPSPTTTSEQEPVSQPGTSAWDGTPQGTAPLPPTPQLTPTTSSSSSTITHHTTPHTAQTPTTPDSHTTTPVDSTPDASPSASQPSTQSTSQPHLHLHPTTDTTALLAQPDVPLTPNTPNSTPPATTAEPQSETPHDPEKMDVVENLTPNGPESGPSFKVVDCDKPLSPPTLDGDGLVLAQKAADVEEDDGVELEDLSEELIAARHMRCEIKEKKRFMSVIKKRSRSVRADSIGACDDAVLPIADLTAADSPIPTLAPTPVVLPPVAGPSTPPSTPAMAPPPQLTALLDEEMELAGERLCSGSCSSHEDVSGLGYVRQRSLSGRLQSRALSASFTSTSLEDEDLYESGVDPWPSRTFPLSDLDYELLFQDNTPSAELTPATTAEIPPLSNRPQRHASTTTKGGYTYNTATPENSNPTSPIPSSSNSSVMDDDPNDPEWTVVEGVEKPTTPQPNGGIILKFAKR